MEKMTKRIKMMIFTTALTIFGVSQFYSFSVHASNCITCTSKQGKNKDLCVKYDSGFDWCDHETTGTDCCGNLNPT